MGVFETFVALRLLRGVKRQKGFIPLSTLISTLGVAVGVMALIVVIGVMTGFDQDLKKKILSVNAHVIILQQGSSLKDSRQVAAQVKTVPGVVDGFPFIYNQVMLSAPGNISGGVIRGSLWQEHYWKGSVECFKKDKGFLLARSFEGKEHLGLWRCGPGCWF